MKANHLFFVILQRFNSRARIKKIKTIVVWLLGIIIGLHLAIIIALNIPFVQRWVGTLVSDALSEKLNTKVTVGQVDMGLINQIVISDVIIEDQQKKELLKVDKIAAKIKLLSLFDDQIYVHAAQLFDFDAHISKASPDKPFNFQFIVDAFTSKEKKPSKLNLRINSLIMRDGNISYDINYKERKDGFDSNHLQVKDFNAHLSLKSITPDSIMAQVRSLSFTESKGLRIQDLSLKFEGNKKQCYLTDFNVRMPHSILHSDTIKASYDLNKKPLIDFLNTEGTFHHSYVMPSDFKSFNNQLSEFDERFDVDIHFIQKGKLLAINQLDISSQNKNINISSNAYVTLAEDKDNFPTAHLEVDELKIQPAAIPMLFNNLQLGEVPPMLHRLGNISYDGSLDYINQTISIDGNLTTALGKLTANLQYLPDHTINGHLISPELNIGTFTGNPKLDKLAMDIDINGVLQNNKPIGKVNGDLAYLDYNGYRFQNIQLDADYTGAGFDGIINIDDAQCQVEVDGKALLDLDTPEFNLTADVSHLNPHAFGMLLNEEKTYSGRLTAQCTGNSLNNLLGSILVEEFVMHTPQSDYRINDISFDATQENNKRLVSLYSDFMQLELEGNYLYTTIPHSVVRVLERYMPSLVALHDHNIAATNQFYIKGRLTDATPLQQLFGINLKLDEPIEIDGNIDDIKEELQLNVTANMFNYNNAHYELGKINCNTVSDAFLTNVVLNKFNRKSIITLGIDATAKNDQLLTNISWNNNHPSTNFSGKIVTTTEFQKQFDAPMLIQTRIHPSEAIINDTVWNIRPATIDAQGKHIAVNRFTVENGARHLIVDGVVSTNPSDSLIVDLNDINVGYVCDAINWHVLEFKGDASGKVYASNIFNDPQANAKIQMPSLHFQGGYMGRLNAEAFWDKTNGININGIITEFLSTPQGNNLVPDEVPDASALTTVKGYINPIKNTINLDIQANNTNIKFLEGFLKNVFKNVDGRVNGWVNIGNNLIDVDVTGGLTAEFDATVTGLNTRYHIKTDSINLYTNHMKFDDIHITDRDNHTARGKGNVYHNYTRKIKYDFDIDTDYLLCYDTHNFDLMPFYATAYASAQAGIRGDFDNLSVSVVGETKPGTIFVYDASAPDEVHNTQFITFVDKAKKNAEKKDTVQQRYLIMPGMQVKQSETMNMYLDFQVAVQPDATIRVVMDKLSGDNISCNGLGNLQANYYNKGAFNMFGVYNITKGVYKMSMQEVIRKDFILQNGGAVNFNGDPYSAQLDMKAVYVVNSASLRDLSPTATFSQNSTTRVNCIMNMAGTLLKPQITFGLELPNVSEEDKDMVKSLVSTEEQMNMQIIYLLGVGRFYGGEYAQDSGNQTNQAMNSILTSTLSGQFNQMLSQVINSSNWNIGTNVNPGREGLNDMEFQTMLSGSLFNNRLLINGNFGYRENALANSNFVGDFDLQWLLNKSGTISLKAYNETNDRYFVRNTLTTQGIGILVKRDFNKWSDLFRSNKPKKDTINVEVEKVDTMLIFK